MKAKTKPKVESTTVVKEKTIQYVSHYLSSSAAPFNFKKL
jgi:hypothetical protein